MFASVAYPPSFQTSVSIQSLDLTDADADGLKPGKMVWREKKEEREKRIGIGVAVIATLWKAI